LNAKVRPTYKRDSLFLAIKITETVSATVVNADRKYQVQWSKIVWPKTLEIESANFILFLSEKNNLYKDKKILLQSWVGPTNFCYLRHLWPNHNDKNTERSKLLSIITNANPNGAT